MVGVVVVVGVGVEVEVVVVVGVGVGVANMSIKAITWAFEQKNITAHEKLVLIALADHANDHGVCWPGQEGLSEKCCISRQSICRILGDLEKDGFCSCL